MIKTFKIVGIIGFVLSAIFTITLWMFSTKGLFNMLISGCTGFTIEIVKLLTAYIAVFGNIDNHEIRKDFRIAAGFISAFCFVISITASLSYLSNMTILGSNAVIEESQEWKNRLDEIKVKEEEIKQKQTKIDSMNQDIEMFPADNVSKRLNAKKDVSIFENEKVKLNEELATLKDMSTIKIDESKLSSGFKALTSKIAGWINSSDKKSNLKSSDIEYWFFFVCAILFDIISLYCYVLGEKYKNPSTKKSNEISIKEVEKQVKKMSPVYAKNDNKIGFAFDDNTIKAYIDIMYQDEKDGIAPGYQSISGRLGLDDGEGYKIKGYLEKLGVVETKNKRTYVLKSKHEAKELLKL